MYCPQYYAQTLVIIDGCQASSAVHSAGGCNGNGWITGPVTTVRDGRMPSKALAETRVVLSAWKWFSEVTWSSTVVLGNHPISVSRMPGKPVDLKRIASPDALPGRTGRWQPEGFPL